MKPKQQAILNKFNELLDKGLKGFTISREGYEINPGKGYAVAYMHCQDVYEAMEYLGNDKYLGYWKDEETGYDYIEVIEIFQNPLEAIKHAINRKQVAVYDFAKDNVIRLDNLYG